MLESQKLKSGTIYGLAAVVCLILGLLPLHRWLSTYFTQGPFAAIDLNLLQVSFLLGAALLTISLIVLWWAPYDEPLFHVFVGVLIVHLSLVLVEFWKYLFGLAPDTWSEQVISLSARLSDGIAGLYSMANLEEPPFLVSIYPPVYYGILKLLLIFDQSVVVGRYVSVVAVLVTSVLFGVALYGGTDKRWSIAAPLLFLAIFPIMAWDATLAHPEFLAATLSFSALVLYARCGTGKSTQWIFWCAFLAALALLTKPTAFAALAAIAVHLMWSKRFTQCIALIGLVLILVAGTYAALWVPTSGGIWFMTITGNAVSLIPSKIIIFGFAKFLSSTFVVLALAASIILLARKEARGQIYGVAALFFLISLLWFMVSVGKPGSGYHYFLQSAISGTLVIALLLRDYAVHTNRAGFQAVLIVLMVTMAINLVPQAARSAKLSDDTDRTLVTKILADLKTEPGEYIMADPYYSFEVTAAGHPLIINDSHPYTLMVDNGVLSSERLVDQLKEKRIGYVVLQNTLDWHIKLPYGQRYWPTAVVHYLQQHYACTPVLRRNVGNRFLVICEPMSKLAMEPRSRS